MARNVILTGFMGVGKTSVGNMLAEHLRFTFIDTDVLIEADQSKTITEIFGAFGEAYFRDVESRIIAQVLRGEGQIVSTGGGAVIREENRRLFRASGLVVCLIARPDVILDRIKHETHRPLLHTPDPRARIEDLLAQRTLFYADADLTIDTSDKSVASIVTEILERVQNMR